MSSSNEEKIRQRMREALLKCRRRVSADDQSWQSKGIVEADFIPWQSEEELEGDMA